MGRYVGNKWREDLPSLSSADQQQGNNEPISAPAPSSPASNTASAPSVPFNPQASTAAMNAAGYLDTPAGRAAYAAGSPAPAGSQTAAAPAVAPGTFTNPTANRDLLNAAQQAAYQAYLSAKLNLDTEDLAFKKAQDAFSRTIQEAGLTGTYQGAPTMAAKQQEFQHGVDVAALTGTYNGAPTLAAQAEQNKTALGYLGLIGGLRGPADPFQYLRTLQGTPEGIKSVVDAAAGRYVMGSAASGEVAPRATLGSLVGAATGPAPATPDLSGLPLSNQIDPQNYNRMLPSQKAALWAAYEYGGPTGAMRPEDAQAGFLQSLPRYTYAPGVAGTVKL